MNDARNLASTNIVIILFGNKRDLEAQREVSFQEATQFAKDNELIYTECSALNGENVEETFLKCARAILTYIESGDINPDKIGSGIQFGDLSLRQLQRSGDKDRTATSNCVYGKCVI